VYQRLLLGGWRHAAYFALAERWSNRGAKESRAGDAQEAVNGALRAEGGYLALITLHYAVR